MNLALFDFDGTITVADSFVPFVYFAVAGVRRLAGNVLLTPVGVGYKLGLVSATHARSAITAVAFSGRSRQDVSELGASYAQTLPQLVRSHAAARLRWHQAQGDQIVVVSASLSVYLDPWCKVWGADLISNELEHVGDRLTGRYLGGDCCGEEKAARVRARYDLSQYARIYAYGDTSEDLQLLQLAHEPYYCWRPGMT